jgi:hypothetical protein
VFSQLTVLIIPLALAFAAVIAVTYLSNSLPLNGICRQCGENLPRRGIVRCPWCRRLCFVLRFR